MRVPLLDAATIERFWTHVLKQPNGCWLWTGKRMKRYGYGNFSAKTTEGKWWVWRAHRIAWMIERGPIPDGMHVLHRCDCTNCVNLDDLWLGTQAQNMEDMRRKGRGFAPPEHVGCAQHLALLTPEQVQLIRLRVDAGERSGDVARSLGLGAPLVLRCAKRETYRDLP